METFAMSNNRNVDIKFSALDALPSSGTLNAKLFESQIIIKLTVLL